MAAHRPEHPFRREGDPGYSYAYELLSGGEPHPGIGGLHWTGSPATEPLLFNALASRRRAPDWDNLSLDTLPDLHWVYLDGMATFDLVDKLLFAGAPAVLALHYADDAPCIRDVRSAWYDSLLSGASLAEAFEQARAVLPTLLHQPFPADPYEFWAMRERLAQESVLPWGLYSLAAQADRLLYRPYPAVAPVAAPVAPVVVAAADMPAEVPATEPVTVEAVPVEAVPVADAPTPPAETADRTTTVVRTLAEARRRELEHLDRQAVVWAQQTFEPQAEEPVFEQTVPPAEEEPVADDSQAYYESSYTYSYTMESDPELVPPRRLSRRWGWVAGIVLLLAAGGWYLATPKRTGRQPEALPVAFAHTEAYNILLLPFKPYDNCEAIEAFEETALRDRLNAEPESRDLGIEVAFLDHGTCPAHVEDARHIGEIYQADLVIWGDYAKARRDSSRLHLRYVAIDYQWQPGADSSRSFGRQTFADVYDLQEGQLYGTSGDIWNWLLALTYLRNDNYSEALRHIRLIEPDNSASGAALQHLLARVLAGQGQYELAIETFDAAIERNPGLANLYYLRGELLERQSQQARAVMDYRQAVALDPRHFKAHDRIKVLSGDSQGLTFR
ncbi:MAG: hypothetical protein OHK0039_35690 [Bacteroidia bacterium]